MQFHPSAALIVYSALIIAGGSKQHQHEKSGITSVACKKRDHILSHKDPVKRHETTERKSN